MGVGISARSTVGNQGPAGTAAGGNPSKASGGLRVADVVGSINEISSLPHVAIEVIRVVSSPQSGANDLLRVVESDPALSARILKVVNSAACGLRVRVTNLHHALCLLGQQQVRNLAVTLSVSEMFRDGSGIGSYTREGLWRHLVATAIASRFVASRCGIDNYEEAFLAGLLHDLGIIIEDQVCHPQFVRAMKAVDGRQELVEVERAQIGFDHCTLGAALGRHWRFPDLVVDAMQFHHRFGKYNGPEPSVVASVVVANCIATLRGRSSVGRSLLRPPLEAMQQLGIDPGGFGILVDDVESEFTRQHALFDLEAPAA